MRIALKVSSGNEYCDGGCEFVLVDLTPELARLKPYTVRRRMTARFLI